MNFFFDSFTFLKNNILDIKLTFLILCILLISITLYSSIYDVNNSDINTIKNVISIKTVENMENNDDLDDYLNDKYSNFCQNYSGDSITLDNICSKMSKSKCNLLPCCVFANIDGNDTCVAGNNLGPTYKSDSDGNQLNIKHYTHNNKLYK